MVSGSVTAGLRHIDFSIGLHLDSLYHITIIYRRQHSLQCDLPP